MRVFGFISLIALTSFMAGCDVFFGPNQSSGRSSLVGYWSFDNISDSTVLDLSGKGNDGTIHGAPEHVPGIRGMALRFDGVDDYVEIPSSLSLSELDALTIEAWIRIEALNITEVAMILNKEGSNGIPYEIGVVDFLNPDFRGYIAWHLSEPSLSTNSPGIGLSWHEGGGPLPMDEWVHIALVYDGSAVKTFINGNVEREFIALGNLAQSDNAVRIAARGAPGGAGSLFKGIIDEVKIHNKALTSFSL